MLCARVPHAVCASAPTGASTSTRTRRRLPLPRAGASVSGNESTRPLPLLPEECHPAVTRATAIGGHHMHSNPTHPSPVLRCSADGLAVSGPELSWENEGGHLRAPRGCREMSSRPLDAEARNRLADEHALLLHQVAARADDVLAADAANRWPRLELAGLIDNLRSELIGQTRIRGTTAVHRRRHHFGRRLGPGSLATTSGCGAPWKPSLTPEPPVGARPAGASRDRSRAGHSAHRASPSRTGSPVSIRDERGPAARSGCDGAAPARLVSPHPRTVSNLDAFSAAPTIDAVGSGVRQLLAFNNRSSLLGARTHSSCAAGCYATATSWCAT